MIQQPSLFVSHGTPTLAIDHCPAQQFLRSLSKTLNRPDAIVIISAHHVARGIAVTTDANPETIHDFSGFPSRLYEMTYPAPGAPNLAEEIVDLLLRSGFNAHMQSGRGFDHGAWVPLSLIYPNAQIPVVQVSIDVNFDPALHYRLGQMLKPLRKRNILMIGSGSITHNLNEFIHGGYKLDAKPLEWVVAFSDWIASKLELGDVAAVLGAVEQGPNGRLNHPTPEHILPLFTALGAGGNSSKLPLHRSTAYGVLAMDIYGFGDVVELQKIYQRTTALLA